MSSEQTQLFTDADSQLEFYNRIGQFQDTAQLKGREGSGITSITGLYSQLPKRFNKQPKTHDIVFRQYKVSDEATIQLQLRPAVILKNKKTVLRFPTIKEDNVEDALAYIACQGGIKEEPSSVLVGVYFTIRRIRKVCTEILGVTYSHAQVLEALDILSNTSLILQFEGDSASQSRTLTNPRISNLATTSKDVYLTAPDAQCYCEFHKVFARDIQMGQFYTHDLKIQSSFKRGLSLDLYKRLSVRYRNASKGNSYWFMAKEVLANSATGFDKDKSKKGWASLREALEELKEKDLITNWDEDEKFSVGSTGGRKKIEDIRITVHAGDTLISLQKLSHKTDKETNIKRVKASSKKTQSPKPRKSYHAPPIIEQETDEIDFG